MAVGRREEVAREAAVREAAVREAAVTVVEARAAVTMVEAKAAVTVEVEETGTARSHDTCERGERGESQRCAKTTGELLGVYGARRC